MREILFRGKRKDNGEWVEGFYVFDECALIVENLSYSLIDNQKCQLVGVYPIIPETVGQYTGLCDKNGKKIFEGDVVRDKTNRVVYEIFYCNDSAMFIKESVLRSSLGNPLHLEVIGNIHDNPELLKEREG